MSLSLSLFPLRKKISIYSSSLLWRIVKKKIYSSRMSHLLSETLTSPTYLSLISLKIISIPSPQTLNIHEEIMLSLLISLDILRAGGTKTITSLWGIIEYQDLLKTRRSLRKQSNPPSDPSLISKSKKLPTKNKNPRNSWAGSTSASYQPSKPSNTIINCAYPLIIHGMHSIWPSTLLSIIK